MKRAEKRAKIKAARAIQKENYLVNRYIRELEQALNAAQIEKNAIKKELETVKQELKSTRQIARSNKASHQQLRETTTKIITTFKVKIPSLPRAGVEVIITRSNRTKAQWLEQNKSNFIEQFINRLMSDFPMVSKGRIIALKNVLINTHSAVIEDILKTLDDEFRHQYYESNAMAFYEGKGDEDFIERLFNAFNV